MDFTLRSYARIIEAALEAGLPTHAIIDWHDLPADARRGVMLRHDVDRRPENALAMARLEAERGVRSSYYFRIVPTAFHPGIIKAIAELGHEIGYHYEDWWLAGRDPVKARRLFESHLSRLQQLAPIRSIAMHGSPLARENNMTIWKHFDFAEYGLVDAILSLDYRGHVFFTDSGRTFGVSEANLRDYLGNAGTEPSVRTSDDLAAYLRRCPENPIQINVHPERWNEPGWRWYRQLAIDHAANSIKRALKMVRSRAD